MRYYEFVGESQSRQVLQPDLLKQQARVAKVVNRLAATDVQQPTEDDIAIGMMQYSELKKRNNKLYAQQLQQQANTAKNYIKS
jgi:hypothetical protein